MTVIDIRDKDFSKLKFFLNSRRDDKKDVNETVGKILKDVREKGDAALKYYTEKFDKVVLDDFKVKNDEIKEAYQAVDDDLVRIIKEASENIFDFHRRQKPENILYEKEEGIKLGMLRRPLTSAGVYVPGGTAPLPSSVLMNVIPAKVAGVKRIAMATPPDSSGKINPVILVAAKEAGADEIYKVGGAQAIAAFAYGTETIKKVDKITGPGNIYVATAKQTIFGVCDIDMIAGPSEILIIADETANPEFLAADLLSQAEHDRLASSILITSNKEIADKTKEEVARQLDLLPRREIAASSINNFGAIVLVSDIEDGIKAANEAAPEHFELCVKEPFSYLDKIENAGAIFLRHYTPEALGDYYAGPNHVLPTAGTARFFSPLNVWDFMKQTSVISYSKKAFLACGKDVEAFAMAEGLDAHARSVRVRLK